MATRTITGVLLDSAGQPMADGSAVKFSLVRGAWSATEHVPPDSTTATTAGGTGAWSIEVYAPAAYDVFLPDDYTFRVVVPAGAATTLEALRLANESLPDLSNTLDDFLAALELDDLANVNAADKADGDALLWDADTGEWVPGSVAVSVAWADVTGKPTTLAGYGIDGEVTTAITDALNTLDIEDMNDAVILSPTSGDVLFYNSGKWRNEALAWGLIGSKPTDLAGYGLDTEVDALLAGYIPMPAAPDSGDVLTWNGSAWVASAPSGGGGVSFPLLASGGTAGAPDYSWSGDTDTGWYRSGANEMSAAVNGAQALRIGNTAMQVTRDYYPFNIGNTDGILQIGSATALSNSGGTGGTLHIGSGFTDIRFAKQLSIDHSSASTSTPVTTFSSSLATTGTAANGFGQRLDFLVETSTGSASGAGTMDVIWADATNATRKGAMVFYAQDTAYREFLRGQATGSAPAIGFLGATPAARQTGGAATAGGAWGATEQTMLQTVYDALRLFGLLT